MHFGLFLFSIPQNLERTKMISKAKQKDITSKQILKKCIDKKLNDFLSTTIIILNKKKTVI